jgi:hypothetical protein
MIQSVAGANILVNIARAVSRLKTIFFSFDVSTKNTDTYGYSPGHLQVAKSMELILSPNAGRL